MFIWDGADIILTFFTGQKKCRKNRDFVFLKAFLTSDEYDNLDILAVQVGACLDDCIIVQVRGDHEIQNKKREALTSEKPASQDRADGK